MTPRARLTLASLTALTLAGRALLACATDANDPLGSGGPSADDAGTKTPGKEGADASAPASDDASPSASDANAPSTCPGTTAATQKGETCIGFGKTGSTCANACGRAYGFVCVGGGPPGFEGCVQVSTSSFGESYCCAENKCVAQPDQDKECVSVSGKPHRYQCPIAEDGGPLTPPSGCTEKGSGGSSAEKFYCCP